VRFKIKKIFRLSRQNDLVYHNTGGAVVNSEVVELALTIASYNDTSSLVRFENKTELLHF
jgi:hypothetical protein